MSDELPLKAQYVLHPDVSESAFVAFGEAARGHVAARLEESEENPFRETILRFDEPKHELRFVDDGYVEVSYAVVKSDVLHEHHQLISKLQEKFRIFSLLDLRELMRSGDEGGRILALRGYGAIFDGFWGAIPKDYAEGLRDERRAVRESVLAGMARIAWLEFVPILESAITSEQDEALKEDMVDLLTGLRKFGKRGIDQMF